MGNRNGSFSKRIRRKYSAVRKYKSHDKQGVFPKKCMDAFETETCCFTWKREFDILKLMADVSKRSFGILLWLMLFADLVKATGKLNS